MNFDSSFVWGLIFGLVGMAYVRHGKLSGRSLTMGIGLALMVFPYFVSGTVPVLAVGGVLTALPLVVR